MIILLNHSWNFIKRNYSRSLFYNNPIFSRGEDRKTWWREKTSPFNETKRESRINIFARKKRRGGGGHRWNISGKICASYFVLSNDGGGGAEDNKNHNRLTNVERSELEREKKKKRKKKKKRCSFDRSIRDQNVSKIGFVCRVAGVCCKQASKQACYENLSTRHVGSGQPSR